MEVKVSIDYPQLLDIVRQLPASQKAQLLADTHKMIMTESKPAAARSFQDLLRAGPVMSDDQYEAFVRQRKHMSKWRRK